MDAFFKIRERGSSVSDEIIGGVTTFLAMAYIVAVNPGLMEAAGIPFTAALTSTCLGAAIMTIAMGLIANRPIALASGMGINAIVAYTLCLGEVGVDWRVAMSVIFLEGIVILILVLCGLRKAIMDAIPVDLRRAIGIGIGLFFGLFVFALVLCKGDLLCSFFTTDAPVIANGYAYLKGFALETILTAILFSMIGYFNGSGKTVFVMAQGLFQTLLVRLPMAYIMSIQPNASLTMIGLAAPTSTAVGVLLNVCFFLYLDRKAKKQG